LREINHTYWVWSVENKEISIHPKFLESIGYCKPKVTADHFWDYLITPDDLPVFHQKIKALVENPDSREFVHYSTHANQGETQPLKISGEQLGKNLIAGHIEFIGHNLTDKDGYLMSLLMKHMPHSIFFKDRKSRFIRINQTCAKKFGLDAPEEAIGKTDFDFFEKEHAAEALKDELQVMETGTPIIDKVEKEIFSDDQKSVKWASTSKIPMFGVDGEIIGTFGITRNITSYKKQQDELKETIDIITHQNNRFQNFAHIVSHNLRNHAGNISMIMSLMELMDNEEEKDELLVQLNTASERLNETIEDLNEIVDVQSNTDLEIKPVSVYWVFEKIKDILSTEIFVNNVEFDVSIPEDFEIDYNPSYMESILLNLVSNAIKYRDPDRTPTVKISLSQKSEGPVLTVSDNGQGVDLDKYGDDLFGMYKTFHGNSNSKGIGLYLTKNQVESLGGSIHVESIPDKGTTFTVYFGS